MKTTKVATWMAALVLAAGLSANAQGPGGGKGEGGGGAGGPGGQHERPSPEQMARKLVEKHDGNKDGLLAKDELTQALEALRANRPKGPGAGGPGGAAPGGEHKAPPPAAEVAAKMIEKFSSDGKGLAEAELAKALAEHRANRGQPGGGKGQGGPKGGPDAAK